jgi:hypothetical protein
MAVATHDEIHIGLDYIDEVARILVDAAMHHDDPDLRLSESRLWFLAHAVEEASGRPCGGNPMPSGADGSRTATRRAT